MGVENDRAGLGKIIYSVEDDATSANSPASDDPEEVTDVEEADKESFPASDPPSFAGGSVTESE